MIRPFFGSLKGKILYVLMTQSFDDWQFNRRCYVKFWTPDKRFNKL